MTRANGAGALMLLAIVNLPLRRLAQFAPPVPNAPSTCNLLKFRGVGVDRTRSLEERRRCRAYPCKSPDARRDHREVIPVTFMLAVVFTLLEHFWACKPGPVVVADNGEIVTDICYWFFVQRVRRAP